MKIFIPTPLRQYAGKQDAVEVHASTVSDALTKLTSTHPDLKRHLYTDDGKLRAFVNLYLNDEDVRYLSEKENTRVKDGDHLSIIPSIAGGIDLLLFDGACNVRN
ncbi:MAG: molybdopterin synthase sulfur carrier subunit [Acidobacteria bacterium]|nr:MAG: molybdopterin synthase sulfur carrier subunit [Acidobacteriota bacterium]PYY19388.1 MAG: molybdopterin synthase sulfur carrier subunit [Acidobacteriota bacterium]